jgi:hypothetical protein
MTIAEQVYERLKNAPPALAQEVLDFIAAREAEPSSKEGRKLTDFAGLLKDSKAFEGDAVELQRAWRAEWDRDWDRE